MTGQAPVGCERPATQFDSSYDRGEPATLIFEVEMLEIGS
jgi:FKBP-type peptidyl-prolyl cis-trans isomerase